MILTSKEERWMLELSRTMLPSGTNEMLPAGANDIPLKAFFRDVMSHAPFMTSLGIRAAIWVLYLLGPLLVLRKFTSYASLDESKKLATLEGLAGHRIYALRELPLLLKTFVCMAYGAMPAVQRQLQISGIDGRSPDWAAETESS